jgi:predicted AAA+ superfamily ATPase
MDVHRTLDLCSLLKKKSHFLFGPRSTGKSYLARKQLSEQAIFIDLLDGSTYLRLLANPSLLESIINSPGQQGKIVVIDEIQKVPLLLDQVHRIIELEKRTFLLTGSSARKLRGGGGNLLAGRAWDSRLFPLTAHEIPNFNLDKLLRYGGLPNVYYSDFPSDELSAYVKTYLAEEIQAEGVVRKIPQFARFLKLAALSNGQLLNFSSVSSDCGVSASTIREYFSILEDTLIGWMVAPWQDSKKRKAIQTSKFYLFDLGVTHALAGTETLDRNSDLYGTSFEQWIGLELRAYCSYRRIRGDVTFWRSVNGQEVDFLVGTTLAVEVKATERTLARHGAGLRALQDEGIFKRFIVVSNDSLCRSADGVEFMHWRDFIRDLWDGDILPP